MRLHSFFEAARLIRLSEAEHSAMGDALKQHLENNPVRLQEQFRHPIRMTTFLKHLLPAQFLRKVRFLLQLAEGERRTMRETLQEHMRLTPRIVESEPDVPREWAPFSLHFSFLRPTIAVTAAVLLLVGGVSSAAEGAMPGETLYLFKVHVSENVLDTLTFTEEARAQRSAARASRRLNEAVTLAAQHTLSGEQSELVRSLFIVQARRVGERIHSLQRHGLEETALEVLTEFEASLSAHGSVLRDVVMEETALAETAKELLQAVDVETMITASSQRDMTSGAAARGQNVDHAVASTHRATQAHLKHIRATVGVVLPNLPPDDAARIDAGMRSAVAGLHESEVRLAEGASIEALDAAGGSLRRAEEAKLRLEVGSQRVGKALALPEWNIRFVPDSARERRRRTEIHQERERLKAEKQQQKEALKEKETEAQRAEERKRNEADALR